MAETLDLSREVRAYQQGQDRSAGFTAPSTTGGQQQGLGQNGDGSVQPLYGRVREDQPDTDARGPAMRGSANAFRWRRQHQLEMQGYRESMAFRDVAAGGNASVDPNVCANWYFTCAGNVTISVVEPVAPPDFDPQAEAPSQTVLATFYVLRNRNATITFPAGWKWSSTLRSATGADSPFGAAAADGQEDVFTVQLIPGKGWRAFPNGLRMA